MKPLRQIGQALDRMSTASKLGVAFAIMIVLTGALGATGLWALERVNQNAQHLAQRWLPSLSHLEKSRIAMLETRDFEVRHTRAEDEGYMEEYEEKTASAMSRVTEALAAHQALLESTAELFVWLAKLPGGEAGLVREVVGIMADAVLAGGGSFHCSSQQMPSLLTDR